MGANETQLSIAEIVANFLTTCTYDRLPARAVDMAKLFTVDVVGCMLGATDEPQARAIIEVLLEEGGNEASTIVGGKRKTSAMHAAFVNGAKGHVFDFDDDHREGTMHPSV